MGVNEKLRSLVYLKCKMAVMPVVEEDDVLGKLLVSIAVTVSCALCAGFLDVVGNV